MSAITHIPNKAYYLDDWAPWHKRTAVDMANGPDTTAIATIKDGKVQSIVTHKQRRCLCCGAKESDVKHD